MTDAATITLIALGFAVVLLALFKLGRGTPREDRPGPHNNWRRSGSRIDRMDENFPGLGTDGASGGGSD